MSKRELKPGDTVRDADGARGTVLDVKVWRLPGQAARVDIYVDWQVAGTAPVEATP